MAKRLSREEKWQIAITDLINQMFKIAGHNVTYDDIKDRKDAWYTEWTMTMAQHDEWRKWGEEYLQKNLKLNRYLAKREMAMAGLNWGLKFSDFETNGFKYEE
jgi:hypothetical protein